MKRGKVVALLVALSCCWLGCSQQVDPTQPNEEEFICTIDGNVWKPKVSLFSRFPLSSASYYSESLHIAANREAGKDSIESVQIACDSVRGLGEQKIKLIRFVRGDVYGVVMPGTASVYLTMLDTASRRVAGTFHATFVTDSGVFIHVEDGHFNLNYYTR